MRVNSISTSYPLRNVNRTSVKVSKPLRNEDSNNESQSSEVNFKGGKWKFGGAIGGTIGTLAGIGAGVLITAATGGLAAPLIGAAIGCGTGAIGGDMIEETIRKDLHDDDDSVPG